MCGKHTTNNNMSLLLNKAFTYTSINVHFIFNTAIDKWIRKLNNNLLDTREPFQKACVEKCELTLSEIFNSEIVFYCQ